MTLNDREILCGVEADGGHDLADNLLFNGLALAIAGIEALGNRVAFVGVGAEQQVQGLERIFETAGGIESRGELETNFLRAQRRFALGDFFEGVQADAFGLGQLHQAAADEDTVFAGERDEVGDSSQRDEIEECAQINLERFGEAEVASALEDGVCEFEGEADRTQFAQMRITAVMRIDEGAGIWRAGADLMVIENDRIDALRVEPIDDCGGA